MRKNKKTRIKAMAFEKKQNPAEEEQPQEMAETPAQEEEENEQEAQAPAAEEALKAAQAQVEGNFSDDDVTAVVEEAGFGVE